MDGHGDIEMVPWPRRLVSGVVAMGRGVKGDCLKYFEQYIYIYIIIYENVIEHTTPTHKLNKIIYNHIKTQQIISQTNLLKLYKTI